MLKRASSISDGAFFLQSISLNVTFPMKSMLKSLVFIASLLFVIASPCVAGEIPFTLEKGFIIVDAKIKKDIAVKAAIFTGSPDCFFGHDIIFKYKITT